jgi:hypothetical protein
MTLSRNQFFLLLTLLLVGPFYVYRLIWLANSRKTTGIAWFIGHNLENDGSVSRHLVVLFKAGKDSITFNAGENLGFKEGDPIPIRYQQDDVHDARINIPSRIWGDTWVDTMVFEIVVLILFLTPPRFDPLIPFNAKVRVGWRPLLKIIPTSKD